MEVIDGNAVASDLLEELAKKVQAFEGHKPCVVFIRVGEDPASVSYVRKKEKLLPRLELKVDYLFFRNLFQKMNCWIKFRN